MTALLVGAMHLSLAGCSTTSRPDYASLDLVSVAGTVTLDGIPLRDVEVRLETPDEAIYSYGVTDASGRFDLMFDSRTPGIIPGRKRVIIVSKGKAESEIARPVLAGEESAEENHVTEGDDSTSSASASTKIPSCYGTQSTYFVNVDRATQSLAIELRSDCSNSVPSPP